MSKKSARKPAAPVVAAEDVPMPMAAKDYGVEVAVTETVAAVAKATVDVAAVIAARAAKWGFGGNVEAYNRSREAQSKMRKAKSLGDEEAAKHWHGIFRELNRNKKAKYASA